VRCAGAALAAVVVLGCSDADGDSTTTTTLSDAQQHAEPEVTEVPVAADLVRLRGGTADTAARALVIEPVTGSALLSFPATALDSECLTSVVLTVSGPPTDTPIKAWVSIEAEAAAIGNGDPLGDAVVIGGSPSAEQTTLAGSGDHAWDVTELLAWSRSNQPASASFVVVLKPEFTAGSGPVELGASEAGEGAVLRLTQDEDCT
jgi:hypothetical protein